MLEQSNRGQPPRHILFEELRQREMLEGLCQLHAALIISRLGSLTEPNLPVKNSAHTRTHTDVLMLTRNHKSRGDMFLFNMQIWLFTSHKLRSSVNWIHKKIMLAFYTIPVSVCYCPLGGATDVWQFN